MELSFDSPDLAELCEALARASRRGMPNAARAALNNAAFLAREQWQRQIQFSFIERNQFTRRSILVDRARGRNVSQMESKVGSVAPYMKTQEDGDIEHKRHKYGVAIPTKAASGEGRGSGPRRKLVKADRRLPNIQLGLRVGSSMKQRNAVAIDSARRAGRRFVFLDLERRKGIFRLRGGGRRPKVDMMYDLSRASVRIPASHTLSNALEATQRHLPGMMANTIVEEMRRQGVIEKSGL